MKPFCKFCRVAPSWTAWRFVSYDDGSHACLPCAGVAEAAEVTA